MSSVIDCTFQFFLGILKGFLHLSGTLLELFHASPQASHQLGNFLAAEEQQHYTHYQRNFRSTDKQQLRRN